MGGQTPKAYRACAGAPLLAWTLRALGAEKTFTSITVVIHRDDEEFYSNVLSGLATDLVAKMTPPAYGGSTRQESVCAGLESLARAAPDFVLIHDAARPFVSTALIGRAITSAKEHGAAIPAVRLADAVKSVDESLAIINALAREPLRAAQTPQAFAYPLILDAHRRAALGSLDDDAAVAMALGRRVQVFEGEAGNFKVTTMEDFRAAERRLCEETPDLRVGQGFDVHAFAPGDHLWLCGLRVAHSQSLLGHSDADVALHALADAIYGALGDGDIGQHFPPSDEKWRGAASAQFVDHAVARLRARGGILANIDITLICEAPKIGPHRDAMRQRLSEVLGIEIGRVSVKATTSERLGFTGRGEGIACLASASIRLPL